MASLVFCGCSVIGYNSGLGWGGSKNTLTVNLVEDELNGDLFFPPPVGTPIYFYHGPFEFFGLLQRWQERNGTQGKRIFTVDCEDPRDILDGCKIILSGYNGGNAGVPNLMNIYGYYENTFGFGASLSNEVGMPWNIVRNAIQVMTNLPFPSAYGGALRYKGVEYAVDLSQLPVPPSYYRVTGGASLSLLQAISQVCEDGGFDYFVELEPGLLRPIIKIRTVSRFAQPPLGTVTTFIHAQTVAGNCAESSNGLESRNEVTSKFLVGGQATTLHITEDISAFFGFYSDGTPVVPFKIPIFGGTCDVKNSVATRKSGIGFTAFKSPGSINRFIKPPPERKVRINGIVYGISQIVNDDKMILFAPVPNSTNAQFSHWRSNFENGGICNVSAQVVERVGGKPFNKFADQTRIKLAGTTYFIKEVKTENMLLLKDGSNPGWLNGIQYLEKDAVQPGNPTQWAGYVDATEISGYLMDGSLTYFLTELEMRFALCHEEIWMAYLTSMEPGKAQNIGPLGLKGIIKKNPAGRLPKDFANANVRGQERQDNINTLVYNWVRKMASNWLGRKYWVSLPFLLTKTDPETLVVQDSQEVSIEGGYLPDGSQPLGLSEINSDTFRAQDGRYLAFARFENAKGIDLTKAPEESVIEQDAFFCKVSVDTHIITSPLPAAIVTLQQPVFKRSVDEIVGEHEPINVVFDSDLADYFNVTGVGVARNIGAFGNISDVEVSPTYFTPTYIAIPLRSNVDYYGPWVAIGAQGKTEFEHDSNLVPWNYGGFAFLNNVANAKVSSAITFGQIYEAGSVRLAGAPLIKLGDVLQAGGPEVSNIEVSYGPNGITTYYQYRHFTVSLSTQLVKQVEDRFKKLAGTATQLAKASRIALRKNIQFDRTRIAEAFEARLARAPKRIPKKSPHPVLIGSAIQQVIGAPSGSPSGTPDTVLTRVGVSSLEYSEGPDNIGVKDIPDYDLFNNSTLTTLTAVMRPFTYRVTTPSGETPCLPIYQTPSGVISGLSSRKLNPFASGNDLEYLTWHTLASGELPSGGYYPEDFSFDPLSSDQNESTTRCVALRGPLVIAGWGYGIDTKPVPGDGGSGFYPNHMFRSDLWPVAPLEMLYDDTRKVWTSFGREFVNIISSGGIPAGGSGSGAILDWNVPTGKILPIWNRFSRAIPSGQVAAVEYFPTSNRWAVIAADCV